MKEVANIGSFIISDEETAELLKKLMPGMDTLIDEMMDNSSTMLIVISQVD